MLTEERKAMISERLRRDGRIVAKALAQELGLSEDTIRRDLREMASDGLLARVHGGALPLAPALPDLKARMQRATAEKQRLGQCAAALIKAGQTIFIDGGSTHVELVRTLPRSLAVTIVTHSPTIAAELGEAAVGSDHYQVLFVLGGVLVLVTFTINLLADRIVRGRRRRA